MKRKKHNTQEQSALQRFTGLPAEKKRRLLLKAVDLDPESTKDQMPSAWRVVLQAPSLLHSEQ